MASLKEEIDRLKEECSARENTILELKSYVTMKEREEQERDKEFTEKSEWWVLFCQIEYRKSSLPVRKLVH